ncbi:MAG: endo alpha-1,4 polygalactosaminidase [Myxococcales bacterium]|nr:endo alpha-1,4 polygalactosaminidase [Myxococcales bacterium]
MRNSAAYASLAFLLLHNGNAVLANPAQPTAASVAFYYGRELPAAALAHFDRVIVQADVAQAAHVDLLRRHGTTVYAYVSLSEVSRPQADALDARFRLGDNLAWQSVILDASQPAYRHWLVKTHFQGLWQRGYRAFFLDNLDSYQSVVQSPAARLAQVQGLVQIIQDLHAQFAGVKLLFNRGFELLPQVAQYADGLVAESLFRGWDPRKRVYVEVSVSDRNWLLAELRRAQARYQLPIIAVDYVDPKKRDLARHTAQQIIALGITPWVTDHALSSLGVGTLEVIPRRILALYNGGDQRSHGGYGDVAYAAIHRSGAMVLEQLGYAMDYADVSEPLPTGVLRDTYAGIVTWFTDEQVPHPEAFQAWLLEQIDSGLRVAILDHLGFFPSPALKKRLGFLRDDSRTTRSISVLHADPQMTGFEAPAQARQNVFYPLRVTDPAAQRLLSVTDSAGQQMDAVFLAEWGGVALDPYLLAQGPAYHYRWIVQPFAFLQRALALPDMPVPDVTTQDGKRMLIVHIDGDGFPSRARMPGNEYSGKVILDQILKHYPVKATVSIIEGELGAAGKWPQLSPVLEAIARDIFALPNVEVASHSYSHPFSWLSLGTDLEDGSINGLFRYQTSLQRELQGSIDYINQRLAPKSKPVKVFLWSGEAVAPLQALAQLDAAGIYNMNGGDTIISSRRPTLTAVSPMGRPLGGYYQVYAPIQNEIVFTNEWRGPYYGFREVISSFQLTELPRRLKPINIYFHFYSGSKLAALKALRHVLDWSLSQDVVSVFASEYIRKVLDFQQLTLARRSDGCWQVRGRGDLATLRLDPASTLGRIDGARSTGVLASHERVQGRYISLDASGHAIVCLEPTRKPPALPRQPPPRSTR